MADYQGKYTGAKVDEAIGKALEDHEKVSALELKVKEIEDGGAGLPEDLFNEVDRSGFNIADGDGNVMFAIDNNGLDAAKLSPHFKSLLPSGSASDDLVKTYGLPLLDRARPNILEHNYNNRFVNFGFITDTHTEGLYQIFNLNATYNMELFRILCNEGFVDFGIHCGDLYTDYGTSREEAMKLIDSSTQILNDVNCPMFFVKGNHDNNGKGRKLADVNNLNWANKKYFIPLVTNYGLLNASFTYKEVTQSTWDGTTTLYEGWGTNAENISKYQYHLLTQRKYNDIVQVNESDKYGAYFYKDFGNVRIVVLNYYDKESYEDSTGYYELGGLSNTQKTWLTNVALNTSNYVVVFSHWYNAELTNAIKAFKNGGGNLVAFIHGHAHQDQYLNTDGFNNIGVRNGFGLATEISVSEEKAFSFSVFSIDTDNKVLYEERIGQGYSRAFSFDTPSQIL